MKDNFLTVFDRKERKKKNLEPCPLADAKYTPLTEYL